MSDIERMQCRYNVRRVLGKMKCETGSVAPSEFVGLRPKMYSLKCGDDTKCQKKIKGIKKSYVKSRVRHESFLKVLRNSTKMTTARFRTFRSTNHVVNTVEMTKLCLSGFDDKRYLLENGTSTLAYGHRKIASTIAVPRPGCPRGGPPQGGDGV